MRVPVFLLALTVVFSGAVYAQTSATYRVTLASTWSAQTHPEGFPSDPHYSPLVGAIHRDGVHLWTPGGTATPGIEAMAETGATSTLAAEVDALVASGDARQVVSGGALSLSPGQITMDLEVDDTHSRVTLVTMLAPSPDWFIGTDALDLQDAAGAWQEEVVVPMYVWDAGTDSGPAYTSPDADTSPQEPISRIETPPFVVGGTLTPVGTMTFTRLTPASGEEPPSALSAFSTGPQPVRDRMFATLPVAPEARVDLFDLRGRQVLAVHKGPLAGGRHAVDVSALTPGVYLLRLMTRDEMVTRRVVIAR